MVLNHAGLSVDVRVRSFTRHTRMPGVPAGRVGNKTRVRAYVTHTPVPNTVPAVRISYTTAPAVGEHTAWRPLSCHVAVMISMPQSAYGSGVVVITGRPPGHSAVGRPASMACAVRQSIPAAMKPPTAAAAG